jgi:hypothetical protein
MTVGAIDLSRVKLPTLEAVNAEIARRTPVWTPQKGPQTLAYHSLADITGYGGAAGGGKSDWITGMALTQHRRSIIFRREHTEVRDLFARAVEILQAASVQYKANHSLSTVYLPRGDRQLEFGGIKNPNDWTKYRGRPKDGYFFDEGTEFEELMIRSLIGWNRTTVPGQRCRVGITFNPPTVRGQWIIGFFAPWLDPKHRNPAAYGELRWFTTINNRDIELSSGDPVEVTKSGNVRVLCGRDGVNIMDRASRCAQCGSEIVYPLSRTFIKALLDDNEYLKSTNYRATLMALPEPLRSQLLYGDFQAQEADDPHQVIPTRWVQLAQERWVEMASQWPDGRNPAPLSAIGADIARGGIDRTSFAARSGTWFDYPVAYPGVETPKGKDVIERLVLHAANYKIVRRLVVGMDVVGVGSSPADMAEELNIQLVALHGAEAADEGYTDTTGVLEFANKRAQWYWQFREALNPETGDNLALPPDRELLADLCAPHYSIGPRGITIESKDDIRKRLGRSPDKGDAVIYAFAARPMVIGHQSIAKRSNHAALLARAMGSSWKSKRGF